MKNQLLENIKESTGKTVNKTLKNEEPIQIAFYPPEAQGTGAFDGGRITEFKPIAFPYEGPTVRHVGPLFYWAWASANGYGKIALHPHKGFEILSYVIEGEIGHGDTLGTVSRVRTGGAQVMQTGSGVSHEEETLGNHTEFFQIWFEPFLQEAFKRTPTYREFNHEAFPIEKENGVTVKSIIGRDAPVSIETDVIMQDVSIDPDRNYERNLAAGRSLAIVTISGKGALIDETKSEEKNIKRQDFAVIHAKKEATLSIKAESDAPLRLTIIEVPAKVDYPLYKN
ncbi:MAG TPA: pirin family protein [Nitrospinota bacterium]|jgi:hypothetical protein|nr:pirin family protein [Nitrospinota bacterium]|tara:strand:- start:19 stop:867 length:849 start_codon:yes stop_codon:yes gene_type:complete